MGHYAAEMGRDGKKNKAKQQKEPDKWVLFGGTTVVLQSEWAQRYDATSKNGMGEASSKLQKSFDTKEEATKYAHEQIIKAIKATEAQLLDLYQLLDTGE